MSKQIPELTIITTPTAGQESLIETVVARHDTYATSRMTLAQIFTLGSISGAIKSALDALTTAIWANTTAITTKLNTIGWTRTGLTANRALITDASGVETYLTGTTTQVIGFDGAGKPIAVAPSVDINGQTLKATPIGADEALISDSEASWVNKKVLLKDIVMISEQTAQSAFTGDTDLFVVKQASGGLRKMTVADVRRAFINSWFQTSITTLVATSSWSVSAWVWTYSTSLATWSNGWWLISAVFRVLETSSNYPDFVIQTSPDNSTWTDIWTWWFIGWEGGSQTNVQVASCVFNAAYVRIGVSLRFAAWSGYKMYWEATVNLTK